MYVFCFSVRFAGAGSPRPRYIKNVSKPRDGKPVPCKFYPLSSKRLFTFCEKCAIIIVTISHKGVKLCAKVF